MRALTTIAKIILTSTLVYMMFGMVRPSYATTWIVRNLNNDGKYSLRAMVEAAQAGDTIIFAPNLAGTLNLSSTIELTKSLTIIGAGNRAIKIRYPGQAIFWIYRTSNTSPVLNMRLENLEFIESGAGEFQGAIWAEKIFDAYTFQGSLALNKMTFSNGLSALYAVNFDVAITNTLFQGHQYTVNSIDVIEVRGDAGSLLLANSEFSNNMNDAVYLRELRGATIRDTKFQNNQIGVLDGFAKYLTVERSQFIANGGAILAGNTQIYDSLFERNGFALRGGANVNIYRSLFKNIGTPIPNDFNGFITIGLAGGSGPVSHLSITNSTFYQDSNGATAANGIIAKLYSSVEISNSTFYNSSSNLQFMLTAYPDPSTELTLRNSILMTANGSSVNCGSPMIDGGYNLQFGGASVSCPQTIPNVNPNLATLGNNGGQTETMALLPSSPAIDAGDPTGCKSYIESPKPVRTDQRGFFRPVNSRCDIGAFEYGSSASFGPTGMPPASMK